MADLSCEACGCFYNMDKKCSKGLISVGGKNANAVEQTCCETFTGAKGEARNACDCADIHTSINCDAVKCTFNSCGKCSASHVSIEGQKAKDSAETACGTFSNM